MEMGGNFCQILELGRGLLLRDGEYAAHAPISTDNSCKYIINLP